MKRLIMLFVFFGILTSCSAEISEEQQVRDLVNLYLQGMMYHQYSDEFPSKYGDIVFHPDSNELGDQTQYKSIKDVLSEHQGINIVSNSSIDSIISSTEKVYPTQDTKNGEKSYFVKVIFQTVAVQSNEGLNILSSPINIIEYFVLGKDKTDNKYKIIDSYPDPASLFIDLQYAIEKIDLIGRITKTKNIGRIKNALQLQKK